MDDILNEAAEEMRAQKWRDIATKAAPYAAGIFGAALIGALGYWGYASWQDGVRVKASETYEAGFEALQGNDKAKARTLFTEVSQNGNGAYKAVALMQLGGLSLDESKPDEALKDFDAAAKASSSPLISDVAVLRGVYLRLDAGAPFSEIESRLNPILKDGRPFQPLAKEALGLAKIANGDTKGARADFQSLSITLGTPDAVKQRAQAYVLAIDSGTAETARAVSKAKIPDLPAGLGAIVPQQ